VTLPKDFDLGFMAKPTAQFDSKALSHHRFTRPGIRLWLPVIMILLLILCATSLLKDIRPIEIFALIFLIYLAISALVAVCEITVVAEGLIIERLLSPKKFISWNNIDRVIVFSHENGQTNMQIEIASIGMYEGLSPLNRLPGLVYGQGLRQTIIITPDMLENYDLLLETLNQQCLVIKKHARR
jgi:hypothetical protein